MKENRFKEFVQWLKENRPHDQNYDNNENLDTGNYIIESKGAGNTVTFISIVDLGITQKAIECGLIMIVGEEIIENNGYINNCIKLVFNY